MALSEKTIIKIKSNPFYKPSPGQISDEYEEDDHIETFGVIPKNIPDIPIHPFDPKRRNYKKQIDQ